MSYLLLASGGLGDRVIIRLLSTAKTGIYQCTSMALVICGSAALMYLAFLGYRKARAALNKA